MILALTIAMTAPAAISVMSLALSEGKLDSSFWMGCVFFPAITWIITITAALCHIGGA